MPTLNSIALPPPREWSEFEDLCCDLWRLIWSDPNAQKNGRTGQSQKGVDIYGYPQGGTDIEALQCKATNWWRQGQHLTQKDIEAEIAMAMTFKPRLSRLIITTTAPRDATLQETVRTLSCGHYRDPPDSSRYSGRGGERSATERGFSYAV
jgi:hypothetical protein